jgi:E3 ubiquitin-protein ligase DOA10
MKASDSVNSLTELNPTETNDASCFICLSDDVEQGEPLVSSKLLRNCGCKFHVHPQCWNEWMKGKSDYDCPICHKQSMKRIPIPPNPVLAIVYQEEQTRQRITPLQLCIGLTCMAFTSVFITAIVKYG